MPIAQANVGFPIDLPIPFVEFGMLWRVVAIAIVVVTGLILWLFRSRGNESTSIHVRRGPARSAKKRATR